MLTMKASDHIRTSGNIRGLHSCRAATGFPLMHLDAGRVARQDAALQTREQRRERLDQLWSRHREWGRRIRYN